MMMRLPLIAQRVFNTPLAMAPSQANIASAFLMERMGFDYEARIGSSIRPNDEKINQGYELEHGVAIIKVSDTLVHKNSYIGPDCGMTGYDGIRHSFSTALKDPKVQAIAFDIDSPGGEVSGCFDLVETIYEARGQKPMMAILSEIAFSAAYAIASAADIITVPPTGGVGSVGVVAMHVDMSQAIEDQGMKVTLIHFGDRKVDGNETQPLSSPALNRIQKDVNTMGEMFVKKVARNRGLTMKAVRDTEAGIFLGKAGVDIGFADFVLAPHEAFEQLVNSLS